MEEQPQKQKAKKGEEKKNPRQFITCNKAWYPKKTVEKTFGPWPVLEKLYPKIYCTGCSQHRHCKNNWDADPLAAQKHFTTIGIFMRSFTS